MLPRLRSVFKSRGSGCGPRCRSGKLLLSRKRQYIRPLDRNRDGVFGMGRRLAVERHHRPFIAKRSCFGGAEIEHWLDRETIPCADLFFCPGTSVIWDLRCLVHMAADAMAGIIADDTVA